jgi:hypothetical protein
LKTSDGAAKFDRQSLSSRRQGKPGAADGKTASECIFLIISSTLDYATFFFHLKDKSLPENLPLNHTLAALSAEQKPNA